jgi:hypothetical protein
MGAPWDVVPLHSPALRDAPPPLNANGMAVNGKI